MEDAAFPLNPSRPEQRATVVASLGAAGFDETNLCRVLHIKDLSRLGAVEWNEIHFDGLSDRLRCLIKLFLYGEKFARAELERALGLELVDALRGMGLVRCTRQNPDLYVSPVFFYPVAGFLIASDRHDDPDGLPYVAPPDVVMPAIFEGTLRFLRLLPAAVPGAALDLCGGSGIGALCLGRSADRSVSVDINQRATRFAEFNARLNGCGNVEAACGDLYDAVPGHRFACISAHPPFVPALGPGVLYRDGGAGGEDITERIVQGLPAHLVEGGTCYLLTLGIDKEDATFEERVRGWLGEGHSDFDVVFGLDGVKTPEEVMASIRKRIQDCPDFDPLQLLTEFRKLAAKQFVYGALVIHRHTDATQGPQTRRVKITALLNGVSFDGVISRHCR